MRNFNMLAALSAALLTTAPGSARENPGQVKTRKVCRSVQMSGRITPQRICRLVPVTETSVQEDPRRAGEEREAKDARD